MSNWVLGLGFGFGDESIFLSLGFRVLGVGVLGFQV